MKIEVRDCKTKEVFFLDPTDDRAVVKTSDGEKVKLYPVIIRQFVGKGHKFDGNGRVGPRTMERLK